ncbi:MAG: VWA domain-containing protein [Methylovirgula sp.]
MNRFCFRDPRFWLLLGAFFCFLGALILPPAKKQRDAFDVLFTVDITGSMNTRDYTIDGHSIARLDFIKGVLRQTLVDMPCQSRVAIALFSERRIFLLFDPIEVCENFSPVMGAINALDWREAWEGDSHIADGFYRAIALADDLHADLVFMTDGQEAPPLPWSGGPAFDGKPGAVKGLVVGVGGYGLSPIPRYDNSGREVGFYGEHDVLQESRFGIPPPDAVNRPGYNPRNSPFGDVQVNNNEHLSSVRETYLKSLGQKTGMAYTHLTDAPAFIAALRAHASSHVVAVMESRGVVAAAMGFFCLLCVYLFYPFALWLMKWRRSHRAVRFKVVGAK